MIRINLLPWRQALAERRRRYFLVLLLVFACLALAAVWLAGQVIDQAIDRQVSRNNRLGEDIGVQDSRIRTIDDLQERSQQLAERMKVVQDLHDARSSGARLFDELARAVPEGVHLHEVVANGDTISIRGSAESHQDIAQLMRRLEATQGAHATRLERVQAEGERGESEFQLMVRQGETVEAQP
ncbi:fimbriae biosynthesis protein [Pseudomonas synxantha]|uniref:Fimbriae biosynthesis protein n=2 Tax=Pseudomonas fluorescens group TaxID=136843 RepID=A0ABR5M0M0_9PSED|nr:MULTISPECIES: PilN domain-containing protein [Pseudomonas]AKA84032.1 Type IV pilus biogenesis protein PilN [Pseudomonas synxantha]AMS19795.1 fimbriae biosynthesis protein [Pseudomonas synxantha]KPG69064.1 fimbriae biosynthesis protein [Pseudomonas libanensis]KRA10323.1 fimbriae biosynthesis protein [Pseudomonas sp. Root569]MDT3230233.1 PilN domain-containing protein [Pseudomonas sp. rhizo25]